MIGGGIHTDPNTNSEAYHRPDEPQNWVPSDSINRW